MGSVLDRSSFRRRISDPSGRRGPWAAAWRSQDRWSCGRVGTLAVAVAMLLASCADAGEPGGADDGVIPGDATLSGSITVLAAASLTEAFGRLGEAFEEAHPGTKVTYNFGPTPALVAQIQQGAPADVLASADELSMKRIADRGLLAGSERIFAQNKLQIIVPAGNPKGITDLASLTRPGLVLVLPGEDVPAGRYAAEVFDKAGLKLPKAGREESVKAVVQRVALGEADAGIVYVTDVKAGGPKVSGVEIPENLNVVARFPIAALKSSGKLVLAKAFADFVGSPPAEQILNGFGFLEPSS